MSYNISVTTLYYTNMRMEFKAAAWSNLNLIAIYTIPSLIIMDKATGALLIVACAANIYPPTCIMDEHRETQINSCRIKDFPAEMEKRVVAGGSLA